LWVYAITEQARPLGQGPDFHALAKALAALASIARA
jgi:hypothetical protein